MATAITLASVAMASEPPLAGTEGAERAARELRERHGVRAPSDLHVERMACDEGAYVSWGETGGADAFIVHGPKTARICVAERLRGTPRGRWSLAHELAHWHLHRHLGADALARIHGRGVKTGRDFRYEREADAFVTELLMARDGFAPLCDHARPEVAHLDVLAAEHGTSTTATGKRYASLASRAACALLECKDGVIQRATRSRAWRGEAVKGRQVEATTAVAALMGGHAIPPGPRAVHGDAWGHAALGDVEMTEHAIAIPESRSAIVWLWHA